MEQLRCRPIVHITMKQTAAYKHLVNLARKEKERKRKGGEGSVQKRKGVDMGGVYQGLEG